MAAVSYLEESGFSVLQAPTDILVHSIAFAPRADLQGGLLDS
jgi:enoyl-[acyl-carrier-protein] reductase (NADH)